MGTPARPPQQQKPTRYGAPRGSPNGAPRRPADPARPPNTRFSVGRLWRAARTTLRGQFLVLVALLFALALAQMIMTTTLLRQAYQDLITIGMYTTHLTPRSASARPRRLIQTGSPMRSG